jgi:hypothetical protein
MEKTERDLLQETTSKLDRLIGIIATEGRAQDQQIRVLRKVGFDWNFIGPMTGLKADPARIGYSRSKNDEA